MSHRVSSALCTSHLHRKAQFLLCSCSMWSWIIAPGESVTEGRILNHTLDVEDTGDKFYCRYFNTLLTWQFFRNNSINLSISFSLYSEVILNCSGGTSQNDEFMLVNLQSLSKMLILIRGRPRSPALIVPIAQASLRLSGSALRNLFLLLHSRCATRQSGKSGPIAVLTNIPLQN